VHHWSGSICDGIHSRTPVECRKKRHLENNIYIHLEKHPLVRFETAVDVCKRVRYALSIRDGTLSLAQSQTQYEPSEEELHMFQANEQWENPYDALD
jgi:hypothetical protein